MANSETSVRTWVLGISGAIIAASITGLTAVIWSFNGAIVRLQVQAESASNALVSIQAQLADATAKRYTSDQAALDRAAVERRLSLLEERWQRFNEHMIRAESGNNGKGTP